VESSFFSQEDIFPKWGGKTQEETRINQLLRANNLVVEITVLYMNLNEFYKTLK
jgi:hypothetical protein